MAILLPYGTEIDAVNNELDDLCQSGQSLEEAQTNLADKYGFLSWQQLRVHVDPPTIENPDFQYLACLTYTVNDHPSLRTKAREMLEADPTLGTKDIYSACITGNAMLVGEMLDDDPDLINQRGGVRHWEPLLYACYSRLGDAGPSTLPVVRLLLERGANPNAYYMWGGGYRFTALTGAFGEGEQGEINQPEHPEFREVARALLDAGADPNDGQSLYNRMFRSSNVCLEMLLEYGLDTTRTNNWFVGENGDWGKLIPHAQKTLEYQLQWAVTNNHPKRVELILDAGVDPDFQLNSGESAIRHATLHGFTEIKDCLLARGVSQETYSTVEKFIAACVSLDRGTAIAMLEDDADLIHQAEAFTPDILSQAASHNQVDVVRLLLDLGFRRDMVDSNTPLHEAAYNGYLDLVKELIEEHDCDHQLRDLQFSGTALGWALQKPQTEVVDYLLTQDLDIFDLITMNESERVERAIQDDPAVLERTFEAYLDPRASSEQKWQTPLAAAALAGRESAAKVLLAAGANASVSNDNGESLLTILEQRGNHEMAELIGGDNTTA